LPADAPIGDSLVELQQNGVAPKQMALVCALISKKHKNEIAALGVFPKDKICGMARTRLCDGARDHHFHPLEAPGLGLRGKKQVACWIKCVEDHGGDGDAARAAWPNFWADALQTKKAAKAATKAAKVAMAMKPADNGGADHDGNIASGGPAASGLHGKIAHSLTDCFFDNISVKVFGKITSRIRGLAESFLVVFQATMEGGSSLTSFEAGALLVSAAAGHVLWQF
jgi:hypothetical protein